MLKELRCAIAFTVTTMVLFGGVYPLALWGLGGIAFAEQTAGSLVRGADGTIAGSRLIAQAFTQPQYFHPRPSAVAYNAAATGGSNYGPSNPDHLQLVLERIDEMSRREGVRASQVPSEMLTASGAGLDPHIPPAAADLQLGRVAAARGISIDRVRELVQAHTEPPTLGVLGRARVNVLELNLALDELVKER